jgi:hypothetical protein
MISFLKKNAYKIKEACLQRHGKKECLTCIHSNPRYKANNDSTSGEYIFFCCRRAYHAVIKHMTKLRERERERDRDSLFKNIKQNLVRNFTKRLINKPKKINGK